MDNRAKKLLFDVLASGRSIRQWCSGRSFDDYKQDRQFRRAVEREFEIIGEAHHARKSYENQGVTAALTVRAKAPNRRADEEVWTAAGREIARLRVYFDGARGGQETTFGQDAMGGLGNLSRTKQVMQPETTARSPQR